MRAVLAIGAALIVGYLFVTGAIPGYNSGTPEAPEVNAGDAANKAAEGAKGAADAVAASPSWFEQHPGVLPLAICLLVAAVAMKTWRGLNGFARATLLVVGAGVAVAVFTASR